MEITEDELGRLQYPEIVEMIKKAISLNDMDFIESLQYSKIVETIDKAVELGDKNFIETIIPFYDHFAEQAADMGVDIYQDFKNYYLKYSDMIRDRDFALILAKFGYEVPEDLYENDEEVILATIRSDNTLAGFDLASSQLKNNQEFVIKMLSNVDDYMVLDSILRLIHLNNGTTFSQQILEDGSVEKFIKSRIQELKEKDMPTNHDDGFIDHDDGPVNHDENDKKVLSEADANDGKNTKIAEKIASIKRAILNRIHSKRRIIKKQNARIAKLKTKGRTL